MVNYYINNPLILYYVVFYSRFLLQFLMRVRNPFLSAYIKKRRKKSGVMYYTATFKTVFVDKKVYDAGNYALPLNKLQH